MQIASTLGSKVLNSTHFGLFGAPGLRLSRGNPGTIHPNSMPQLCGVHRQDIFGAKVCTIWIHEDPQGI